MSDIENIKSEINSLRSKIKKSENTENTKQIEFMMIFIEWIYDLFSVNKWEKIRLQPDQWIEIESLFFKKSIQNLNKSIQEKDSLDVLFEEGSKLAEHITKVGNVVMTDFDLLQFNLARVFGKNTDAIIERTRMKLREKLLKEKDFKLKKTEELKNILDEKQKRIEMMSAAELGKMIVLDMFKLVPSARTPKERIAALKSNQGKVVSHREKFRNFAMRLHTATSNARGKAQTHTRLKSEEISENMIKVSKGFREKAIKFASAEGFKGNIRRSQKNIEEKGNIFGSKVQERQYTISHKGIGMKKQFEEGTQQARIRITKRHKELQKHELIEKKNIDVQSGKEIRGAEKRVSEGKSYFLEESEHARERFAGREKNIDHAKEEISKSRERFQSDTEYASKKFTTRGDEIEKSSPLKIGVEKGRFVSEVEGAKERFKVRSDIIEGYMPNIIHNERLRFIKKRNSARSRFSSRAEEIKTGGKGKMVKLKGGMEGFHSKKDSFKLKGMEFKEKKPISAESGIKSIEKNKAVQKKSILLIRQSDIARKKMKEDIQHNKDLFRLDTRFARHRLKKAAQKFSDRSADKNEEFKSRQNTLLRRHKAHQKARLMRNLLRTIRGMK